MIDKDKKDLEQRYQLQTLINIVKPEVDRKIMASLGTVEYHMENGKLQAYSHIYIELLKLKDVFMREDQHYFNWKLFNFMIGFVVGLAVGLLIFFLAKYN